MNSHSSHATQLCSPLPSIASHLAAKVEVRVRPGCVLAASWLGGLAGPAGAISGRPEATMSRYGRARPALSAQRSATLRPTHLRTYVPTAVPDFLHVNNTPLFRTSSAPPRDRLRLPDLSPIPVCPHASPSARSLPDPQSPAPDTPPSHPVAPIAQSASERVPTWPTQSSSVSCDVHQQLIPQRAGRSRTCARSSGMQATSATRRSSARRQRRSRRSSRT